MMTKAVPSKIFPKNLMPPSPPSSLPPVPSVGPAPRPPRAPKSSTERPLLAAPPTPARCDAKSVDEAEILPAPKRTRGRGHAEVEPPAPPPVMKGRSLLWRLLSIHRILSAPPRQAPTAEDLAREVGTSSRNVKRDIATMRHTMLLPIGSKGRRGGYFYTRPDVDFPGAAEASPRELLALAMAAHMARAYAGAHLGEGVRGALQKMRLEMRGVHGLDLDALADVLSFRDTGLDLLTDLDLVERLTRDALERTELRFSYQGMEDARPRGRTAEPLRVFRSEGAWYLLGWDVKADAVRHFHLGRMSRVQATGRRFARTARKLAAAGGEDALGAFGGGKLVRVVLRFRGRAARLVRERRWDPSQKVRALGPTETELTMFVPDSPLLVQFVLRWGRDARVVAPASLRHTVLDHARAMLAQG